MNIDIYNNHCCGCGECYSICPTNAISMISNEQGFLYPQIHKEKCINCSKCVQYCSFNNVNSSNTHIESYALKHKNESIRAESRSGGVFTALSDIILDNGGVIYGCQLINSKIAIHSRATTKEGRNAFRKSKYIQSTMYDVFNSVKNDLKNDLYVLFSGTACQVNAIKDYCADVDCRKLFLIDIVCHGVPSPKVWSDYLDYISAKEHKTIVSVEFRNKQSFGWAAHSETVYFNDNTQYSSADFRKLFYEHLILRKDCFECPFKSLNRISDITIADCWGIAQNHPEFDDNKGVSLVIINTEKGKELFSNTSDINSIPVNIENFLQPALKENWSIPQNYNTFWRDYNKHSFKYIIDKYILLKPNLVNRVKAKVRRILSKCYHIFVD